jgi:hypothetical protein
VFIHYLLLTFLVSIMLRANLMTDLPSFVCFLALSADPPNAQPISSGSAPSKNTTVELAKRKSDEDKQDSPSKKFRSDLTDVASNAFAADPGS